MENRVGKTVSKFGPSLTSILRPFQDNVKVHTIRYYNKTKRVKSKEASRRAMVKRAKQNCAS